MLFNLNLETTDEDILSLTDDKGKEVISFVVNKGIKTITISTSDIKAGTYNLYSGVKHANMASYGIYVITSYSIHYTKLYEK